MYCTDDSKLSVMEQNRTVGKGSSGFETLLGRRLGHLLFARLMLSDPAGNPVGWRCASESAFRDNLSNLRNFLVGQEFMSGTGDSQSVKDWEHTVVVDLPALGHSTSPSVTQPPCNGNLIFARRGAPEYPISNDSAQDAVFIARPAS